MAVGLVASRFLKASSSRRYEQWSTNMAPAPLENTAVTPGAGPVSNGPATAPPPSLGMGR